MPVQAEKPTLDPIKKIRNSKSIIMSDDLKNKGAQDRSRINMNEDHEVAYWTEKFNVSREELQRAVDQAGSSADAVAQVLRSK
ncbi:hypothetical protein QE431_001962 [Flavobacterium sp. SORGH_AS 622]|nr:hypothetical protein [Flavobacterium sp. SORGH_AS_0622]